MAQKELEPFTYQFVLISTWEARICCQEHFYELRCCCYFIKSVLRFPSCSVLYNGTHTRLTSARGLMLLHTAEHVKGRRKSPLLALLSFSFWHQNYFSVKFCLLKISILLACHSKEQHFKVQPSGHIVFVLDPEIHGCYLTKCFCAFKPEELHSNAF